MAISKRTVVLGASPNPARYAYAAVQQLQKAGYETIAVGQRKGKIGHVEIQTQHLHFDDIDTITLYIGPAKQPDLYEYIFSLQPERIIFNPGTENAELAKLAGDKGIQTIFGCTLVMLTLGTY